MRRLHSVTSGERLLEKFLRPMRIGLVFERKWYACPGDRRYREGDVDIPFRRFFGLSKASWIRTKIAHDSEVAKRNLDFTLGKMNPWSKVEFKISGARTVNESPHSPV